MNRTDDAQHASLFGPASELVDVGAFLEACVHAAAEGSATSLSRPDKASINGWSDWLQLSNEHRAEVEADCSVDDVSSLVDGTLETVRTAAHIIRLNRATLDAIRSSATSKKRTSRRQPDIVDPEHEHVEVKALQSKLDVVQLASWKLDLNSALLMRTPINSDYNALSQVRKAIPGMDSPANDIVCLIVFSVHIRTARSRNYFTRMSQHAILSSQSVGDLYEAITCISNEIPREIKDEEGKITGYQPSTAEDPAFTGSAVLIEGVIYGDGQSNEDYSDKVIQRLNSREESSRPAIIKGLAMHDVQLSTLALRLNQPYWMLHAGNCEHTLVIDEIRLKHPLDPTDGYPLTTYLQPTMIDMCRGCSKVPAVWSISGDIRLGESPCLLCAPCWRRMGMPQNTEPGDIVVARLPRYDIGW